MKLLYKHQHEGVWFSQNGHRAYSRGEKPRFMWPEGSTLIPTVTHHIARQIHPIRTSLQQSYTRELLMFYICA